MKTVDTPLYDTQFVLLNSPIEHISFFSSPAGYQEPTLSGYAVKTFSRTNLSCAAMLGAPNEFIMKDIAIGLDRRRSEEDRFLLRDKGIFNFKTGIDTNVFSIPLKIIPIIINPEIDDDAYWEIPQIYTEGVRSAGLEKLLKTEYVIRPCATFRVEINFNEVVYFRESFDITVFLFGTLINEYLDKER